MKKLFSRPIVQKIKHYSLAHKKTSAAGLVVLILLGYWGYKSFTNTSGETRYVTAVAEKGSVILSVGGSGQVSASNQVELKAKISGDVVYVGVKSGQAVRAGTLLAQLDTRDAQKTVRDAQANLDSARLSLEKLKKPADALASLQAENSLVQAQEALNKSYDERLAEAEVVAKEENTDAVKTAIIGYENNMAYAVEESKQIKDKNKAEGLLTSITDNTSKHQEILADVYNKVPDEAKVAITQAIGVSRNGQEEAAKQITQFKDEVEQPKKEITEVKSKEKDQIKIVEEPIKRKSESVSMPAKSSAPSISENTQVPKSVAPPFTNSTQTLIPVPQQITTPTYTSATPDLISSVTIPAEPATPSGTPKSEDTTPPIISNTQATGVAETYPTTVHATGQETSSATVSWVTNESSTMTAIGPNGEVSHGPVGKEILPQLSH